MNVILYLNNLRPALPMSTESPPKPVSNRELKLWCVQGSVLINGERVPVTEEIDYPVYSLVFFPKSKKKRTTLV